MVKTVSKNDKGCERKDTIKWVLAFTAILMLGVMVAAIMTQGFTNANPYGWFGEKEAYKEVKAIDSVMVVDIPENQSSNLKLATTSSDESASSLSRNISATVYPDYAVDKFIIWSIEWAEDAALKNSEVTDYVVLTTVSEGALDARVECIQSFSGSDIIVTATTRVGGYQAFCVLKYEGDVYGIRVKNINCTNYTTTEFNSASGQVVNQYNVNSDSFKLSFEGLDFFGNHADVPGRNISVTTSSLNNDEDFGEISFDLYYADVVNGSTVIADVSAAQPTTKLGTYTSKNVSDVFDVVSKIVNSSNLKTGWLSNPSRSISATEFRIDTDTGDLYFENLSGRDIGQVCFDTMSFSGKVRVYFIKNVRLTSRHIYWVNFSVLGKDNDFSFRVSLQPLAQSVSVNLSILTF